MEKKPYTPPTLTEHGDAVQQTRGFSGKYWETLLNKNWSDYDIDDDDEENDL
jgi:hypothetical protein